MTDGTATDTVPDPEKELELRKFVVTLGRDQYCDIIVEAENAIQAKGKALIVKRPADEEWSSGCDWIEDVKEATEADPS